MGTPHDEESFDFQAEYGNWKRHRFAYVARDQDERKVPCPNCGYTMGLVPTCPHCGHQFGVISRGARIDLVLSTIFDALGGIAIYGVLLIAAVIAGPRLGLGRTPAIVVALAGGPFLYAGIRSAYRNARKRLQSSKEAPEVLQPRNVFALALALEAVHKSNWAGLCFAKGLTMSECTYHHWSNPFGFVVVTENYSKSDSATTQSKQALSELAAADAYYCYLFTDWPLQPNSPMAEMQQLLRRASRDDDGMREFAGLVAQAYRRSGVTPGRRLATLVDAIKGRATQTAQIMTNTPVIDGVPTSPCPDCGKAGKHMDWCPSNRAAAGS